jgi:NADH-quinone oxidoreductase subunit G
MPKMVNLTIDGQAVSVPEGTLVVNAAKRLGIDIPVFCYHPKMEPVGMCRMCLVEIGRPIVDRATGEFMLESNGLPKLQFGSKLETACTTPVSEGMAVIGISEKARRSRRDILEFLLTSHPLDCPVCDKGGECPLQNLTMGWGPGQSRYIYDEKMHLSKHVPLGELIYLDRERCIQCGRCVRFQNQIADDPVIDFFQRGRSLEIVTCSEPGFDSYFSGNTTDICPVGALTTADFRFKARPWELRAAASICSQCPVGCNITFNVRREAVSGGEWVIKRAMPRQNEWVNEIWICDKGRFGYHYSKSSERLTQPLIRKSGELVPATWDEALSLLAERFQQTQSDLLVVASGRLANEDLFNLKQLADGLRAQSALYSHMAGGEQTTSVGLAEGSNLAELGAGSAILVVACDLEEEAPVWWLRIKQAAERHKAGSPSPRERDEYTTLPLWQRSCYHTGIAECNLPQTAYFARGSSGIGPQFRTSSHRPQPGAG